MRLRERRPNRVPYSGVTIVHLGKRQYRSRAINLSETGLLLFAPVHAETGDVFQIKMKFPAISDWFSVEGTLVRMTTAQGQSAWGIRFGNAREEVRVLLRQFVAQLVARGPAFENAGPDPSTRPLWSFGIPPRAPRKTIGDDAKPPPLPRKAAPELPATPKPDSPANESSAAPSVEGHPSKWHFVLGGALKALRLGERGSSGPDDS